MGDRPSIQGAGKAMGDRPSIQGAGSLIPAEAGEDLPGSPFPRGHSPFLLGASRSEELSVLSCAKLLLEL